MPLDEHRKPGEPIGITAGTVAIDVLSYEKIVDPDPPDHEVDEMKFADRLCLGGYYDYLMISTWLRLDLEWLRGCLWGIHNGLRNAVNDAWPSGLPG